MEIYGLAALICLVVVTIGYLVNKYLHLPWMFTVVILGMVLSNFDWASNTIQSTEFQFLAHLGMLLFLFTIGMDLDLPQIRKLGGPIIYGNIILTLSEGLLLGSLFYFVFPEFVSHSFWVALLAGIAFGTVGEVILLALLKEFGLEKTKFGQLALGIGVFDDIFEILVLAIIISIPELLSNQPNTTLSTNALGLLLPLLGIILATVALIFVGKFIRPLVARLKSESFAIPFMIFFIIFAFLFLGSGSNENLGVVAVIFSGVAVKQLLPENFIQQYKKPLFFVANIFLGPFFFLSLGGKMSFGAVASLPVLIVVIMAISIATRVGISYLLFNRLLGKKQSVILGVGLTAKFSTSVISENLLYTTGLIAQPLYSAIMAAFILLKPIIVAVFSRGLASSHAAIHEQQPALGLAKEPQNTL